MLRTWPYKVRAWPTRVLYVIESEAGGRIVRAHAELLSHTARAGTETEEPSNSVYRDSLRSFEKSSGVDWRQAVQTGMEERHFKAQLFGKRSSRWAPLSALPERVVTLFDGNVQKNRGNACETQEPNAGHLDKTSAPREWEKSTSATQSWVWIRWKLLIAELCGAGTLAPTVPAGGKRLHF